MSYVILIIMVPSKANTGIRYISRSKSCRQRFSKRRFHWLNFNKVYAEISSDLCMRDIRADLKKSHLHDTIA